MILQIIKEFFLMVLALFSIVCGLFFLSGGLAWLRQVSTLFGV